MNMKKFTKAISSTIKSTGGTSSAPATASGSTDASGCPPMEGLLLRKNAHGEWKKRHGKLSNYHFITNKPKHKKPTNEIKENIDLREVVSVGVYDDILEIEMVNGETHYFMYDVKDSSGGSIDDWYSALSKRHTWAQEFAPPLAERKIGRSSSGDAGDSNGILSETRIHISGYLQKKSHNKYHGFQERFVKLEGKNLCYYKKKNDDTPLGTASMLTADFVRPYDASAECATFEIQDEDRVFVFQTPSHADMLRWVSVINKVLQAYKERQKAELEAKIASETPVRIRAYDELGEAEFLQNIEIELSEIYPTMEMEPSLTLKEHLSCASEVVQYLVDFVPETQAVGVDKVTRYDILAAVMTEVNNTLTDRFNAFVLPLPDGSRHEILESATLGDLHMLIDWIATYKLTLNGIKCPVNSSTWGNSTCRTPKASGLWELMPKICSLYVHGGSTGAKGGAASHLYDHCMKVWDSVVNNPEEMIQKHSNGSFYTHAPIDMWEAINQHMSLATSTKSPVLHVMIAEKVVISLQDVFNTIITYVQTLDTSNRPELREIELEYISALANDTALHIEEVIELIETFTIDEIRERIDAIFDPLTTQLVQCGQACLKRLAGLVMSDVQATLDEVFMPEWLEGNQVHVATATISDYMRDFESYLVEFWAAKFVYTILETVVLTYIRVILFPKAGTQQWIPAAAPEPAQKTGFFSSLMRKTKEISQKMIQSGPQQVPVDDESRGCLAQDTNTFNQFFQAKAGQDVATEFLAFINEISLMLQLDPVPLIQYAEQKATDFPSAAQAIKITALAVMKMRPEEFGKAHMDALNSTLDPVIAAAPEVLRQQEREGVVESRISLLYADLVPATLLPKTQDSSLARQAKNMAHVNLSSTGKVVQREKSGSFDADNESDAEGSDGDDSASEGRLSGSGRGSLSKSVGRTRSGTGLVDDVLDVLNQQDEQDAAAILAQEEARQKAEAARKKVGVLTYEGKLEKKSPATRAWQKRFFKLTTRETLNPQSPYAYCFMWFTTEGGAVNNSLDTTNIESVSVLASPRALAYLPLKQTLMLQSEALNQPLSIVVKTHNPDVSVQPDTPVGESADGFVVFRVLQKDGKDHILRSLKVDRVMQWINLLSLAASLGYDEREHVWNRDALVRHQKTAEEYAAQNPSTPTITAAKTLSSTKIVSNPNSPVASGKQMQGSPAAPAPASSPIPAGTNKKSSPSTERDEAAAAARAAKAAEEARREQEARAAAAAAQAAAERDAEEEALAAEEAELAERQRVLAEQQAKLRQAQERKEQLAAQRRELERQQREAEEKMEQLRLQEEQEMREKEEMEREAKERQQRLAAKTTAAASSSADDDAPDAPDPSMSPKRGSTSTNPIMQRDGKARDVANPIKRVSSVRRVPPPPPPPPAGADETAPAAPADAEAAVEAPSPAAPAASPGLASASEGRSTSPVPANRGVVRMVGKRRASLEKIAHNNARAAASENASTISGSSAADENNASDDEASSPARGSNDSNSLKSALKVSAADVTASPAQRGSEDSVGASPAGGFRKSLSRGVSFASDVKERTSDPESAPPAAAPSPASPKMTSSIKSKMPFAAAAAAPSQDDGDEEQNDDTDAAVDPERLSVHVAKEGVISGKMYRRSVLVSTMPKSPDAPPQKEGFLKKLSPAMFVGWQERFFVTNANGDIEYYKSKDDAHSGTVAPQGVIMVKYIKVDRGVEVNDKGELVIQIGGKTITLKGKDKAEVRAWASSITQWQLHTA